MQLGMQECKNVGTQKNRINLKKGIALFLIK